jgi:hypothetical protein
MYTWTGAHQGYILICTQFDGTPVHVDIRSPMRYVHIYIALYPNGTRVHLYGGTPSLYEHLCVCLYEEL